MPQVNFEIEADTTAWALKVEPSPGEFVILSPGKSEELDLAPGYYDFHFSISQSPSGKGKLTITRPGMKNYVTHLEYITGGGTFTNSTFKVK